MRFFKYLDKFEALLQEFRNTTEIDTTLLSQIENYIQKIEVSPTYDIQLNVMLGNKRKFFIVNNTARQFEGLTLTIDHGASLCISKLDRGDFEIFSKGASVSSWDFENNIFEHNRHANLFYCNFYYDAYSLCTTLQYLAQCYGYSPEDITINSAENNILKAENDISEEIPNDETVLQILNKLEIIVFLFNLSLFSNISSYPFI